MKKAVNMILSVAMAVVMMVAVFVMARSVKDMVSYDKQHKEQLEQLNISEHKRYSVYGRYNGLFSWEDERGHEWRYRTAEVSGIEVYEGMPVIICFDDNGTPDNIYDDKVLGILYDRETAIYDELENKLSEAFELEREDNNIRIQSIKEVK